MLIFLVRRLLAATVLIWALSLLVFLILNLIPGDPAQIYLGVRSDPELLEKFRVEHRLDQPLYVRYFDWVGGLFRGSLGRSFATGQEIGDELVGRIPVTLELIFLSTVIAVAIGIPAGLYAARRRNTASGYTVVVGALVGLSIPNFWLGILLVLVFAVQFHILPSGGFVPLFEDPLGNLRVMILPSVSLALGSAALLMRMMRSSTLEVLQQDYIRTARAKGAPEGTVIRRHVLKNALAPVVTILGLQIGFLFGGAVLIKTIFFIPGVSTYAYEAVQKRDFPQLQSAVLLIAAAFIFSNLLVDIAYTYLDPRQSLGEAAA